MNHKTYQVNTHKAIGEVLDGEAIIINLQTGSYYSMNAAGSTLWEAMSKQLPIAITSPALETFISFLLQEDLISEVPTSASFSTPSADPVSVTSDPTIEKYEDMQEMLLADPIHDVDNAGWPKLAHE